MYGGVGGRINFALVLGLGLFIAAAPASAADLGGDCCADIEERIAELEATAARKGNRKVSASVSGHVNEAVLCGTTARRATPTSSPTTTRALASGSRVRPRSIRNGRPVT